MEELLNKLRDKISIIYCQVHNKPASVSFRKRSYDLHVQACCKDFKTHIQGICENYKAAASGIKYLKAEHNKMEKGSG